jgi:hypothetical protein
MYDYYLREAIKSNPEKYKQEQQRISPLFGEMRRISYDFAEENRVYYVHKTSHSDIILIEKQHASTN